MREGTSISRALDVEVACLSLFFWLLEPVLLGEYVNGSGGAMRPSMS